jgi:hypothetical protein
MPSLQINRNGTYTPVRYFWVNQGGVWRQVRQSYIKQGGVWKQAYPQLSPYLISSSAGSTQLHSSGDYSQGFVSTSTYSVTNNSLLYQTVLVNATFYYGSHVQTQSTVTRNDGTVFVDTGMVDWNFNVVYHTTQYRSYGFYDSIPPGSTYGYYASMATNYNGDYNYSVGPNGLSSMTIDYSSFTWPDGVPYSGAIV